MGCGYPDALDRKYPNAGKEWGWQWVFPSKGISMDPRSGRSRRHHVSDNTLHKMVKLAGAARGDRQDGECACAAVFVCHVSIGERRRYTDGSGLVGHSSVATTQVYTHVMAKPGLGVRSPLDS